MRLLPISQDADHLELSADCLDLEVDFAKDQLYLKDLATQVKDPRQCSNYGPYFLDRLLKLVREVAESLNLSRIYLQDAAHWPSSTHPDLLEDARNMTGTLLLLRGYGSYTSRGYFLGPSTKRLTGEFKTDLQITNDFLQQSHRRRCSSTFYQLFLAALQTKISLVDGTWRLRDSVSVHQEKQKDNIRLRIAPFYPLSDEAVVFGESRTLSLDELFYAIFGESFLAPEEEEEDALAALGLSDATNVVVIRTAVRIYALDKEFKELAEDLKAIYLGIGYRYPRFICTTWQSEMLPLLQKFKHLKAAAKFVFKQTDMNAILRNEFFVLFKLILGQHGQFASYLYLKNETGQAVNVQFRPTTCKDMNPPTFVVQ